MADLRMIIETVKSLESVELLETLTEKRIRVKIKKGMLHRLCECLLRLGFDHCSCISAVDYIDHFTLVYSFWSTKGKIGLDAYVDLGREEHVPSISGYYGGANWHEREAFDMMGIVFDGHPNLRRILLSEDVTYFPLRKGFRMQDDSEGEPTTPKEGT